MSDNFKRKGLNFFSNLNTVILVCIVFLSVLFSYNYTYKITSTINTNSTSINFLQPEQMNIISDIKTVSTDLNIPIYFVESDIKNDTYKYYSTIPLYNLNEQFENDYYSNYDCTDNCQIIPYPSTTRKVSVHPIDEYKGPTGEVFYLSTDEDIIRKANEQFKQLGYDLEYHEQFPISVNLIIKNILYIIICIGLIVSSLLIIMNKLQREIIVKIVNGYSYTDLFFEIFGIEFFKIVSYFMVLELVLSICFSNNFQTFIAIFEYSITNMALIIFIIIGIMCLIMMIFRFCNINSTIKNKPYINISPLFWMIKYVVTFLTILLISIFCFTIVKTTLDLKTLESFDEIENYNVVRKTSKHEYEDTFYKDLYLGIQNESLFVKSDMNSPSCVQKLYSSCDIIFVNEGYLEKFTSIDVTKDVENSIDVYYNQNHDLEKLDELKKANYYMYDENDQNIMINEQVYNESVSVPLFDTQYNKNGGYLENPIFMVIDSDFEDVFFKSAIAGGDYLLLEDSQTINDPNFTLYSKSFEIKSAIKAARVKLLKLTIFLLGIVYMVYVISKYIYSSWTSKNKRLLITKYHMGYSKFLINRSFLMMNFIVYFLSAISNIFFGFEFIYFAAVIVLMVELICMKFIIKDNVWRNYDKSS